MNARSGFAQTMRLASTGAQTSLHLLVPLDPKPRPAIIVLYTVCVLQLGHFLEHLVQISQVHLLHMPEAQARGIARQLDEEPVHFVFNVAVFVAVVGLFRVFRSNRWLQVALPLTGWHAFEHWFRLWGYLHGQGVEGLLGHGGLLFGGLPIGERLLHFGYNFAELVLLVGALMVEVRFSRKNHLRVGPTTIALSRG